MSSERLETGWGGAAAPGDNLLQAILENFAATAEHWPRALDGRVERLPDISLADLDSRSPYFNAATPLRPLIGVDDRLLDRITSFFGSHRTTPVTLWSAWPTPDLSPRGWQLVGHPLLMLLPAGAEAPETTLDVVRLEGDDGAAVFERTLVEGYPLEELLPYEQNALLDARGLRAGRDGAPPEAGFRCWAGLVDGAPAAVSASYATEGITGVEWVATRAQFRRRGYGSALTWTAATAFPGNHAYLLASDEGRKLYERIGFLPLFRFTLWQLPPAGRSAGTGR